MAAATIVVEVTHGPSGSNTWASAEAPGSLVFNRQDAEGAGSPVIIPGPGNGLKSAYSNYKVLRLDVTVAGTTSISNIRLRKAATEAPGLRLFTGTTFPTSYTQCTGTGVAQGNRPADKASALVASPHPDTPANYQLVPVSPTTVAMDPGPYATTATGRFGNYFQLLLGVSDQYAGGPSSAAALPTVTVLYDEA